MIILDIDEKFKPYFTKLENYSYATSARIEFMVYHAASRVIPKRLGTMTDGFFRYILCDF